MVPYLLDRVEVGSVSRKPFGLEPLRMRLFEDAHCLAMHVVSVEDKDELTAQVAMDECDEEYRIVKMDVVSVNAEVKSQSPPVRCDCDCGNDGQAVAPIPAFLNRGLPAKRPCAAANRLEHIA